VISLLPLLIYAGVKSSESVDIPINVLHITLQPFPFMQIMVFAALEGDNRMVW